MANAHTLLVPKVETLRSTRFPIGLCGLLCCHFGVFLGIDCAPGDRTPPFFLRAFFSQPIPQRGTMLQKVHHGVTMSHDAMVGLHGRATMRPSCLDSYSFQSAPPPLCELVTKG